MILINFWSRIKLLHVFVFFLSAFNLSSFAQSDPNETIFPVWHKDNWYFIDSCGSVLYSEIKFDYASMTETPNVYIASANKRFGLYNSRFDTLYSFTYDTIFFKEKLFFFKKGREWEIANLEVNQKITVKSDSVVLINDHIFIFDEHKTGLVLNFTTGPVLIPPVYDRIMPYKNYYLTYENLKFGLVDETGKKILDPVYKEIQIDPYGIISYYDNYWKYIPFSGKIIDPGPKKTVSFYHTNCWKLRDTDSTSQLFFGNQNYPFKPGFDNYFLLSSNRVAIRKNNLSGLLDINGNILIPPKFKFIGRVTDDEFYYKENDLIGLLSNTGKILTEPVYHDIEADIVQFGNNGYFKVNISGRYGVIDSLGNEIVPCDFDFIRVYANGIVVVKNKLYGFYSLQGKKIFEPVYIRYEINGLEKKYNSGFSSSFSFDLFVFKSKDGYYFTNGKKKVNSLPAYKFVWTNNILKCYYKNNSMDIFYFDSKGVLETEQNYKNIVFVKSQDTVTYMYVDPVFSNRVALLEEDQQTGLYTMRFCTKSGYGFEPKFSQIYPTKYEGYYIGKLLDDTLKFNLLTNAVEAKSYALAFSDVDGLLYAKDTSISASVLTQGINVKTYSTSMDMRLDKKLKYDFFTEARNNPDLNFIGDNSYTLLRYHFGGEIKTTNEPTEKYFLWNYFEHFNLLNNIWFADSNSIQQVMNPFNKVSVTGGYWNVINGPDNNYREIPYIRFFKGDTKYSFFEEGNNENVFIYSTSGEKYGLIGRYGNTIMKENYDTIYWYSNDKIVAKRSTGLFSYYDINVHFSDKEYLIAGEFKDRYAVFCKKNGCGILNDDLVATVNPGKYSSIQYLGGQIFKAFLNGKCQIINGNGVAQTETSYGDVFPSRKGFCIYKAGKRYGLLNRHLKEVLTAVYDTVIVFDSSLVYAKSGSKKEFYNGKGELIRELKDTEKVKNGFVYEKKGKAKYRITNNLVQYWEVKSVFEPKTIGKYFETKPKKGVYELYNFEGKKLCNLKSSSNTYFSSGLIAFKQSGKWRFYDENGNIIHECLADDFSDFGDWIKVFIEDSSYIMDKTGAVIPKGNTIFPIEKSSNGIILCKSINGYYYRKTDGTLLNSRYYQKAKRFSNGYAAVCQNKRWGLINTEGELKVNFQFERIENYSEGKFAAVKESSIGLYSANGHKIIPSVFKEINRIQNFYFVKTENSSGYFLSNRSFIWPALD